MQRVKIVKCMAALNVSRETQKAILLCLINIIEKQLPIFYLLKVTVVVFKGNVNNFYWVITHFPFRTRLYIKCFVK